MAVEWSRQREQMDTVYNRISITKEDEDIISHLPDDIVHRILSFVDMKDVVRTCILSKKWKLIWTSMPQLNIESRRFNSSTRFEKFVDNALSHRNSRTNVSSIELRVTGPTTQRVVEKIVNYAYTHNITKLDMTCVSTRKNKIPQYLFSSRTLKHLTLNDQARYTWTNSFILQSVWDFPALETLNLSKMHFGDGRSDINLDLFSKCVNLKDLILHRCSIIRVDTFNVCAPKLSNFTITNCFAYPKIFNVVAPQLENLTASVITNNRKSPPCFKFFRLSAKGFSSLEKVNLSLSNSYNGNEIFNVLLSLFQNLQSAKFLTVNGEIIEALSLYMNQLAVQPCPFNNLKCLTIGKVLLSRKSYIAKIATQVKSYLLANSPSATFIINLPQKRSREQLEIVAMAKKVAKLEADIHIQKETVSTMKRILEAKIQMQDKVIATQNVMNGNLLSHIVKGKMAELKVQVESGNPDYKAICSMGRDIKSVMDSMPVSLRVIFEARFFSLYEKIKRILFTRINASMWQKIEAELWNATRSKRSPSNNNHSQSEIFDAELPSLPEPSSANI